METPDDHGQRNLIKIYSFKWKKQLAKLTLINEVRLDEDVALCSAELAEMEFEVDC